MKKLTGILLLITISLMFLVNSCNQLDFIFHIKEGKCTQCFKCVPACGYQAIQLSHVVYHDTLIIEGFPEPIITDSVVDKVTIDPAKCIGCGECKVVCPYNAISLEEETTSETVEGENGGGKGNGNGNIENE